MLRVRRTISAGEIVGLAKTSRSRREVPLSGRTLSALDELPPRLDNSYLFAARGGRPFDLHNFRRREWAPAIEASGVARPARPYDLRCTFASNSLAAGVTVFELARLMGTSLVMIERHYGTLLDGAGADIARRLSAFEGSSSGPGIGSRRTPEGGWATTGPHRGAAEGHFSAVEGGDLQARLASAPGRTRTCDPRLRRPLLFPAELPGRVADKA
jgi:hypothetical protein